MTVKFKNFINSALVRFGYRKYSVLIEDMIVALLIGLVKTASNYRFSNSEMVGFPSENFHHYDEIPKAIAVEKLTKHYRKWLILTNITLTYYLLHISQRCD